MVTNINSGEACEIIVVARSTAAISANSYEHQGGEVCEVMLTPGDKVNNGKFSEVCLHRGLPTAVEFTITPLISGPKLRRAHIHVSSSFPFGVAARCALPPIAYHVLARSTEVMWAPESTAANSLKLWLR